VRGAPARPGLTTWVDVRVTCSENVRTDEVILRRAVPAVRAAVLTDRAVSYGVGVPESAPYLLRAAKARIPAVRRSTGGTGLLHGPGDLAWSVVLPRSDSRVGADYVRAYPRLGAGVVHFLSERGVLAKWLDPPGTDPDYCLLSSRGSVLSIKDKVLGGAAQHLAGGALLHHGIVPLELDRPLLHKIFALSSGALDRMTSLRELGIEGTSEELAWKLAARLSEALSRG
jgi:lipoate-protein ligase A